MIKGIDESAEIIADSAYSNIRDWIGTGIYILNACMSGDIFGAVPAGRITTFFGPSSVGKSFLACSCAREAQKAGYTVIYMDSEGAIDSRFVSRLGVDPTKLIIKQISTIAETSQFIANTCKALQDQEEQYGQHQKVMLVLDSLGNLTSDKEREDIMAGNNKRDMTKAQEVKALFRVNATPLAKLGIPMIVNNHSYAAIGSYVPAQVMAAGCLIPEEKIITEEGIKMMKDITTNDKVLSHDGKFHKVLATWDVESPTYDVEFEDNKKITCSNIHRFLINPKFPELDESWKSIDELNEGDEIYILTEEYRKLKIVKKSELSCNKKLKDLTIEDTQSYVSENGIINHNTGIVYNSSVTIELSAAKLEDKSNDEAAKGKQGADTATKNGVLVTAKPQKSRFCRPMKVKFQIPYFKAPNPYVGLETFMTWENSGCVRGNVITEKEYNKLSPSEQLKAHPFEFEGQTLYCQEKDTARGIVVKHLGRQVNFVDFFSDMVFTPEFLKELNEKVIHPMFDLPDQSSFDDIKDIEETLGVENTEDPIAELNV